MGPGFRRDDDIASVAGHHRAMIHLVEQVLNGAQFGVMLFLMAAGLTLIFGIMNVINLAHGSLYMVGAYVAAASFAATGSFLLGLAAALAAAIVVGIAIEIVVFRSLYSRDHLDQVLATFGLILFFNELVRILWGSTALYMRVPDFLNGRVELLPGSPYPTYRLAIIAVGLAVALLLYLLIARTRIGMLIRAGAANRVMLGALGVNVRILYTLVFALGAALAALAGVMAGPIFTVESGMGENVLILAFVVIVIGGIGSIRGAFAAALIVGILDAVGRAYLRPLLGALMSRAAADNAGPALASMLIYILMAAVLFVRPLGLFPPKGR
jgi:branched-chain amino acid transport system permease protein